MNKEYRRKLLGKARSHKRNIQNLSSLVFVNLAVAAVGFVTQIKIANVLGKESFGLIAFGMAIATYGAVIIRFGLDKTLVRDLIHFPDRYTATVKASLLLRFTLFALFIIAILGWKFSAPPERELPWGVVLIIIANAAMSVDLQAVYDSWHKMTRHALFNLLQRGLYFSIIWLILINDPTMLSVFSVGAATLLSVSVYLLLQYAWAMRRLPAESATINYITMAIELARANRVVWFSALAGLSFGTLNQLALKYYHGAAELGGYAAAWMMVTLSTILLTQVARVGNPTTARMTVSSVPMQMRTRFLIRYTVLMISVSLPVALTMIVTPDWVLITLFRPEYATAAAALRVLGFYMLVFSTGLVAAQYMVSSRMEKSYMYSAMIGSAVGVVLCVTIIPFAGSVGAAWALFISHGLTIALYWARITISLRG